MMLYRNSIYIRRFSSVVQPHHISHFQSLLGHKYVLTNDLDSYNIDWMNKYKGSSECVLLPSTTEEVSDILRYCNHHHLSIVPQSGNTSLVGGSVPLKEEIIINMKRMNNILSYN